MHEGWVIYAPEDGKVEELSVSPFGYGKLMLFTNRYFPLISKEEYSESSLKGLVENYFNNSYLDLVSAFAKKENFSMEQLEELQELIKKIK